MADNVMNAATRVIRSMRGASFRTAIDVAMDNEPRDAAEQHRIVELEDQEGRDV